MYSCGFLVKHHCTEAIWFQDDRPPSNQNVRHYRKGIIATVGVVIALVIVVGSIYLMQAGRSDLADMIECPDHIHEPYLDQVRDLRVATLQNWIPSCRSNVIPASTRGF